MLVNTATLATEALQSAELAGAQAVTVRAPSLPTTVPSRFPPHCQAPLVLSEVTEIGKWSHSRGKVEFKHHKKPDAAK